jgi:hypothetical protein
MDDNRRAFVAPQASVRILGVRQGDQADFGEAHERVGVAEAFRACNRLDRSVDDRAPLGIESR